MSKLLNLKEWVTVPDAARHLSVVFGEEISEADVLRFALDGHLTLSVDFVNHAHARPGQIVGPEGIEWRELPAEFAPTILDLPDEVKGKPIQYMRSLSIDDESERYLNLGDEVRSIDGVWDLPMIGGERLDVEHRFQMLTNGPAVTLHNIEGAFVMRGEDEMCQLQESFDRNDYQRGSSAQLESLQQLIAASEVEPGEAKRLLEEHKIDREKFLARRKSRPKSDGYYPAGGLPDDSTLVVRTANLMSFMQMISAPADVTQKPMGERERTTLLTIIAALAKEIGIDISKPSKAGGLIGNLTEQLGAPVSPRTIEDHLKRIPDSLEKRRST